MASPILSNPIVVPGADQQVITVTKPELNCNQVGMTSFIIQWRPGSDGKMRDPQITMVLQPYDKSNNMCASQFSRLTTSNMDGLVAALAQAGRPAALNMMNAIFVLMEDIANNGIPVEMIKTLQNAERTAGKQPTTFSKGF